MSGEVGGQGEAETRERLFYWLTGTDGCGRAFRLSFGSNNLVPDTRRCQRRRRRRRSLDRRRAVVGIARRKSRQHRRPVFVAVNVDEDVRLQRPVCTAEYQRTTVVTHLQWRHVAMDTQTPDRLQYAQYSISVHFNNILVANYQV